MASLPLVARRARLPRRLVLVGAALAILPWLHTRFSVIAACAAAAVVGRLFGEQDRVKRMTALLALPLISAVSWLMFF